MFLFPFLFFIFSNREPGKSFHSLKVLCSNTARMASGRKWMLLDNDWEQRGSGLLWYDELLYAPSQIFSLSHDFIFLIEIFLNKLSLRIFWNISVFNSLLLSCFQFFVISFNQVHQSQSHLINWKRRINLLLTSTLTRLKHYPRAVTTIHSVGSCR